MRLPEMFGENVFNDSVQKETLPSEVYKALRETVESGKQLDVSIAGAVASAMEMGCVKRRNALYALVSASDGTYGGKTRQVY